MRYAAFYFESLHEGRFSTQVEAVENEQDATGLREELGCPELLGIFRTKAEAEAACADRERVESARGWAA